MSVTEKFVIPESILVSILSNNPLFPIFPDEISITPSKSASVIVAPDSWESYIPSLSESKSK